MHTTPAKVTAGLGSLAASTLLMLAVPNESAQALQRPPMPCIAIRARIYRDGAGFCPAIAELIDWKTTSDGWLSVSPRQPM